MQVHDTGCSEGPDKKHELIAQVKETPWKLGQVENVH